MKVGGAEGGRRKGERNVGGKGASKGVDASDVWRHQTCFVTNKGTMVVSRRLFSGVFGLALITMLVFVFKIGRRSLDHHQFMSRFFFFALLWPYCACERKG